MSFLRGSTNYVWCTTSVLGKGATGAVYQGVNKHNGEPVAVKTFNQLSHMRPLDVQMREFEVLEKVKHENIVKLLAIEEEHESRGKVIVMELCTGGSLFTILDDPENTYGLQEDEFLLVLEHLTAGMKHLRDNNLVHRDLKPGNIMKFISDDGRPIYKLTDFGAARELHEDQEFMSLYGTEEYLHPHMYERAVLRKPVAKTFGATVDLWSIGVTLYHVATGNLPFRPYGGRRNKETMHYITTEKASGVISGVQTSEKGSITWGKDLPKNCQLSDGCKKLITPILAGLLELESQRIWSFEKFFTEVTKTLDRRLLHIFHTNRIQNIRVYLHPDETYERLQALIQEQTEISPSNQILLYKSTYLLSEVGPDLPGRSYKETESHKPILLFSKENNNVTLASDGDLPNFPKFPDMSLPKLTSVDSDAGLAKTACSVGHVCKKRIEKLSQNSQLISKSVQIFTKVVTDKLKLVLNKSDNLQQVFKCTKYLVEVSIRSHKSVNNMIGIKNVSTDLKEELETLSDELNNSLSLAIQQLYQRYVREKTLTREWHAATRAFKCPSKNRAPARIKTLVERLRDSWQHLLRDRATRSLTYNDEQFHVLEIIKVTETSRRARTLLETDVLPIVTQLADCMADWYKMAQTVFLQAQILDKDFDAFEHRLQGFIERVNDTDASFHDGLVNVAKVKFTSSGAKHAGRISAQDIQALRASLRGLRDIDDLVSDIKTNNEMLKHLTEPNKLCD
ncbi:serine/threonine-protein kinase TBK1 [Adelges cooleyi]|uniref:serine/threonine-protein kinase TBK1 n=1 Tax=Adelges cooleyi TaxID=133065 RepID=UPI0021800806|nr:serine/threonine-protein kinase TBK1 [Adelges cooleyi]